MNKLVQKYPRLLGSSVDPTQLSLTIKGALGLVATILVAYGASQADLNGLIEQITNSVLLITELVSLVVAIYGGARKIYRDWETDRKSVV